MNDDRSLLERMRSAEPIRQRRALARAITLVESSNPGHRERADALLAALPPVDGETLRIGISGTPGVGKSTLIEALGLSLADDGRRVAVLAVDPSSQRSKGAILGDKTRMERLAVHAGAFVRPSPSGGTLGGVAAATRDAIALVEAAGFDTVVVETVGTGQSEAAVAAMTDVFVLMQLANAGDDLQAMKKGALELADVVIVHKADLDARAAARAVAQIEASSQLASGHAERAPPIVLPASALDAASVAEVRAAIEASVARQRADARFAAKRRRQALDALEERVARGLRDAFERSPAMREARAAVQRDVEAGRLQPAAGARRLLEAYAAERDGAAR